MSIETCNAYVLHTRSYRDTSLLVEVFTEPQGRLTMVARGAKSPKSKWRGIVRPFVPLNMDWRGKSGLKTLTNAETLVAPLPLHGNELASGFYLNELLLRLLQTSDPYPELFAHYGDALHKLALLPRKVDGRLDEILRPFEFMLLQQLGYGFSLHSTADGESVQAESRYLFDPQRGLITQLAQVQLQQQALAFSGADLIAMQGNQWGDIAVRRAAKRLMRLALDPYLGNKPLTSRTLLRKPDSLLAE